MSAAYDSAAIPEPFKILGLKLRPFCIGHYRILRRFECAFVADSLTIPTREDLILGVLVCSMTPAHFMEFLQQKDFLKQVKAWGKSAGLFSMKEKCELFSRYIEEHSSMPQFWEGETGKTSAGDWTQSIELCLTSQLNYTHEEAINLPLSQAFYDYFKYAETMGAVRLMTTEEIEMCDLARKGEINAGA